MNRESYKTGWRKKSILLTGLYTSQTLGFAFVTTAVPVILRRSGTGLDKISLIFVLGFCWSLKFLWAPFIDKYGSKRHGHYRSWIILLQLLMIAAVLCASFLSIHEDMVLLSILFIMISFFSATQDIASDGLAVHMLAPDERGTGSCIQSAGNMVGFMIGGGIVLMGYEWLGWKGSLWVLAAGMALPLPGILNYKEKACFNKDIQTKPNYKSLISFFSRPGILSWLPVLLIFRVSGQITYWLMNPFLVDSGWSIDRIGIAINIIGVLFGVVGTASAAAMVNRLGRKTTMAAAMVLGMLGTFGLLGMVLNFLLPYTAVVYIVVGLIMIGYGFSSTIIYTLIMDKSHPSSAATDFTLQWSITGISAMVGGGTAMAMAESIGYAWVLVMALCIAVISIWLIAFYKDFEPMADCK